MAPEPTETEPELAAVVHAWPRLAAHVKLAIRALINTSR
jgi:hypothetical protein